MKYLPAKNSCLSLLLFALLLVSCRSGDTSTRQLTVLYKSQQCPLVESNANMRILRSGEELENFLSRAAGLGANLEIPQVNFPRETALVVSLGQKPTAGYNIGLAGGKVELKDGELRIDITQSRPGEMAAQVLTSPCLVLKFDSAGVTAARRLDTGESVSLNHR